MNETVKDKLRQNLYYIIIAILSLAVLIVMPFLRSDLSAGLLFPTTTAGWFLFWFEKISVTAINLTIFTAFKKQGLMNVKDNPQYVKARELMNKVKVKKYNPQSPTKYQAKSYGKKGTTLVISTLASLVAITNMLLRFDYLALISYCITILMAIVFGIFAMKNDELYWTDEYYYWALQKAEEAKTLDECIADDQAAHPELTTAPQKPPVSHEDDSRVYWLGPNKETSTEGEI
ncbi:MAG: hypothetical protein IKE94_07380 [Aeriscardovia sp.]|nr:hypothetical protein [Aeriscardovia sp.]